MSLDTDSAMRLAGVRDLLHGQAWFDTSQHRLNTPYGLSMHWSRLVDAPLALLMLAGEGVRAARLAAGAVCRACCSLLARLAAAFNARAVPVVLVLALSLRGDLRHLFARRHRSSRPATAADAGGAAGCGGTAAHADGLCGGAGPGRGSGSLALCGGGDLAACLWLRDDAAESAHVRLSPGGAGAWLLWLFFTADRLSRTAVCDTYSLFYAGLLLLGGAGRGGDQLPAAPSPVGAGRSWRFACWAWRR